jgi:hypothetical protein
MRIAISAEWLCEETDEPIREERGIFTSQSADRGRALSGALSHAERIWSDADAWSAELLEGGE